MLTKAPLCSLVHDFASRIRASVAITLLLAPGALTSAAALAEDTPKSATASAASFDAAGLVATYGSQKRLEQALRRYRRLADKGAIKPLVETASLSEGDSGPAVVALRKRLSAEGYKVKSKGQTYDKALADAVSTMQRRNGLQVDGKVGPETRAALNVTPAHRVRQIELNIERRQKSLRAAGAERGIVVNVAGQRLHGLRQGEKTLDMKVIVGRPSWETPLLEETMEYVVVNPYWYVPVEIIAAELQDEIIEDLATLERKNMEVVSEAGPNAKPVDPSRVDWKAIDAGDPESFPYFLRQKPGPENPLGRIKFIMPNSDDIYLHDTPAEHLFAEHDRELSHGCVRVEKPFELADFVATAIADWSKGEFKKAVDSEEYDAVYLDHPIPVDLVYWTAWVDDDGDVQFREDIYDLDT